MDEYLLGFEEYLREKKSVSDNTIQSYIRDIYQFADYLKRGGIKSCAEVDGFLLNQYTKHLKKMGRSASTISRFSASLRCFYQYLLVSGILSENPTAAFKVQREKRGLPEILTSNEVELLLNQPASVDFKGSRDKAILEVLYATGIRVSELVSLNIGDINCGIGILYCHGSGRGRRIPVYPEAIKAVHEYLLRAAAVYDQKNPENPLFINFGGRRLTRQGLWKIIKTYTEDAGIKKCITPNTLRHSFAAHMLENGADLKSIQEMLGYADISSTQIYAEIIRNQYADVYKRCHPKAQI